MGLIDFVKGGVRELAIARPDDKKGLLVYKHPDPTIPNKAQLTVGTDEVALFFRDGQFVGQVGTGRHTLETTNIVFLNRLIDSFTGGGVFKAEVWFVTTREVAGFRFGGRIGDVEDPKTGLAIQTMVHGDYSLQITDPIQAIQFFGQRSFASDEEFTGWFRQLLLKTVRDRIASLLVHKQVPLLQVTSGALTEEIEREVLEGVKVHLDGYGIRIVRLGNLVVSIKEEDEQTLKAMYKDVAQIRLAGGLAGFQQLAAGKAVMAAGEGGGRGGDNPLLAGAGLGLGMAMAQLYGGQQPGASPAPTRAAASPEERLQRLKSLKEAGLIDDQEYAAKRAEILKDL
ncbi:MAG: SPFH domain-containing protein [Myxococcales bacterium]|nr:SPFH domain-containing protein [Myxococcota bacterium]MDW8280823.1 SPFH domain-containing protein [Myxococcales bacterium]